MDKQWMQENILLQGVINGVTDPIIVVDADFRVKLCNHSARDFFANSNLSCKEEPLCYRRLYGLDSTCDQHGHSCPLVEVMESGKPVTVEHKHLVAGGEVKVYELLASPLQSDDGSISGIIERFRDITECKRSTDLLQKGYKELERRMEVRASELEKINTTLLREIEDRQWAEDQLLEAKEQAELIYRVIPSAIFSVDLKQKITSWNNKAEEITGYKQEEIMGKSCNMFALNPCTRICGVFSSRVKKPIMARECEIKTKDGRMLIISKNADLLRNTKGEVIGGIESFEDITVRKQTEKNLRTERDKLQSMLLALGQGMHIVNHDYLIEYQNDVLQKDFGDKIGKKCYEVYRQLDEPCEICRMRNAIESNEIQRTEIMMSDDRYYEQCYAPFTDVDGEAKALILLRDITEEKAHHAETMRAGQLASIGELAAGVAHEINNPINGIINYAQILWDQENQNKEDQEVLAKIIGEGRRIAGIVHNLLFFSRQQDDEKENIHLEAVLQDALSLIKHQFEKNGIILTIQVSSDLPTVIANHQQLQQVYLNLLNNARHALNQRYPGHDPEKKLDIKGEVVHFEGREFVRITFTDHGTGIPPEIAGSIFDPFFSTKKPGEGTGLGLSISHGLIKNFNGFLRVKSELNVYTAMIVDLPTPDYSEPVGGEVLLTLLLFLQVQLFLRIDRLFCLPIES